MALKPGCQDQLLGVSTREKYLDYVDEMRESSLDWYATMRSLYRQRKKEISGELEDEKVALNVLSIDVYNDPNLKKYSYHLNRGKNEGRKF